MRPASCYPVDRYLVESSKRMGIIEIMDDDLWKPEPALRPEDEFLLRKLHDMLQSTADDLKVLSGELSKYHESGVQVKTLPTPLDEEFNEKIHVEEVVNAKFHGNRIVNPTQNTSQKSPTAVQNLIANEIRKNQFRTEPRKGAKKTTNLVKSQTKVVHIPEKANYGFDTNHVHLNTKDRAVQYNEIVFQQSNEEDSVQKPLQIQEMPSINIRSELKVQQVAHLDIIPNANNIVAGLSDKNNICVISVDHDCPNQSNKELRRIEVEFEPPPVRKISKMSSVDSSESSPNIVCKRKNIKQKLVRDELKKRGPETKFSNLGTNKVQRNLNDWKRKLSSVYGQSSGHTPSESKPQSKFKNASTKLATESKNKQLLKRKPILNNHSEYIPYAKLTLGGVNVKDIEEEISHISNKNDLPLSPILDKILSRQNSFSNDISQKSEHKNNLKILTTSDENLLQEVLDIEEKVSITLSKNVNKNIENTQSLSSNPPDDNTYADDFEADNSNGNSDKSESGNPPINDAIRNDIPSMRENVHNRTHVKISNLSLKNKIETFEFIHTVDTQENATQSNAVNKISLKETQTTPRSETHNRNDLSIDPKHELENMFKLEKDFIKKLIVDEYSDLIASLNKPSTSNETKINNDNKNISSVQKNTQTSPARVKSVMTSPARTKTRTTSPLALPRTIDKQTSPGVGAAASETSHEFDITINLSSPRFQLQLPKSASIAKSNQTDSKKLRSRFVSSSSSSVEDYTSSDISFGEMRRLQRRSRLRVPHVSGPSSSSSKCSEHSFVVPIRSEGELSVCHTKSNKYSKSEGEISLGQSR